MTKNRLYQPSRLREIIEKHEFEYSKSLGQNFLIDGNILKNMMAVADITSEDLVLEIGTGIGTLTEELALNAGEVLSIEIDRQLKPIIEDTLADYSNVQIIYGNVLDIDLEEEICQRYGDRSIKVVANLPYYVTTPILFKLLNLNLPIESIHIMVQKELGERIVANPGNKDYGSLSVYVQLRTEAKLEFTVPRTCFMPMPKVDSAVVGLYVKELPVGIDPIRMEKIVRAAFSKRRKTVLNALSSYGFIVEKKAIREALIKSNIDPMRRAEDISIEEYLILTANFPAI